MLVKLAACRLRKGTSSATSVVYQLYGTTTPFRSKVRVENYPYHLTYTLVSRLTPGSLSV